MSSVFGIQWEPTSDEFSFEQESNLRLPLKRSKRTVLAVLSSVYDPMGLLAPVGKCSQ